MNGSEKIVGEIVQTTNCEIWLDLDGIVHLTSGNTPMDLPAARESVAAVVKLAGGKRVPLLVRMGRGTIPTREAREFFTSSGVQETTAIAMVADSRVTNMAANLYLGVFKPAVPTRLFGTESEAIDWLKGIR